jgi:hypothetical protein
MAAENPFADLRRLADWFATRPVRPSLHVERIVERLGATCVPMLGRELCAAEPARRDAARTALAQLARNADVRARVIAALHSITESACADHGKVCALGLLKELGERGAARFADPSAIQRSSAIALAAQLGTPADIASAADMMVRQLADDDMVSLLAVMADAVPAGAHQLATELCARLDVAPELRERISDVALAPTDRAPDHEPVTRRAPRPTLVHVLVDAATRIVVVATRKVSGERRWRRWAVLVGAHGRIDDCLHEDHAGTDGEAASLVASLVADGYHVTSTELEHARAVVARAARDTATSADDLPSSYYVGRDLLDLGEAHLARAQIHPTTATLGRAVELIADNDLPRARQLLARCDDTNPDVAAANAACLLAQGRPAEAAAQLARAIEAEPAWPLHHWNLAVALHQLGDVAGCYQALVRFMATSTKPSGLFGDPDQAGRVALATRLMAELERTARLTNTSLARPRRKRRSTKRDAR